MEVPHKIRQILNVPLWAAGISFALGTILMLLYMINHDNDLMVWGFLYVAGAIIVNLVVLFVSIILATILTEYRKPLLQRAAVLLLNIPIAILYHLFIFYN